MGSIPHPLQNDLLLALSVEDRALLQPSLQWLDLPLRYVLEIPHQPITHAYFPDTGIASVVAIGKRDVRIEIGLIGREGMSGTAVVLNSERSPHSTYMQVAGTGNRVATGALRAAMKESPSLTALLLKFTQAFTVQTAHTAVSNTRGKLEQRLARWLLMAHDRLDGDQIPLTHEFISLMLGVRRAGVTESIDALQAQGAIRAERGRITVLDRAHLEKKADGFYGGPEQELRRLMASR